VILLDPEAIPQIPPEEVNVSVAVPEKAAGAVHVAFKVVAFGLNVPPADDVHVPPVAGDDTLPPNAADDPPAQIAAKPAPTFTVGLAITVTAKVLAELAPQEFCEVTLMFPFCPAFPVVTVIEVVPAPAVMVHPEGTDQLYVVALAIAAIE
jgi:hypothetical protein